MCTTPFKELSVMERGVRDLCAQLSTSTSVGLAFKRTKQMSHWSLIGRLVRKYSSELHCLDPCSIIQKSKSQKVDSVNLEAVFLGSSKGLLPSRLHLHDN